MPSASPRCISPLSSRRCHNARYRTSGSSASRPRSKTPKAAPGLLRTPSLTWWYRSRFTPVSSPYGDSVLFDSSAATPSSVCRRTHQSWCSKAFNTASKSLNGATANRGGTPQRLTFPTDCMSGVSSAHFLSVPAFVSISKPLPLAADGERRDRSQPPSLASGRPTRVAARCPRVGRWDRGSPRCSVVRGSRGGAGRSRRSWWRYRPGCAARVARCRS